MTPATNFSPVSTTPAENFATGSAGVIDTSGKIATGVNEPGVENLVAHCPYKFLPFDAVQNISGFLAKKGNTAHFVTYKICGT
jgi:hypothetical protein